MGAEERIEEVGERGKTGSERLEESTMKMVTCRGGEREKMMEKLGRDGREEEIKKSKGNAGESGEMKAERVKGGRRGGIKETKEEKVGERLERD